MEIDVKNIKAAYRTATESERTLLFTLFPDFHLGEEEKDNRPVTERIKTFEDACRELGEDHPMVWAYGNTEDNMPDITAYMKLRIISAALNEGWEPRFTDGERRYYPWFRFYTQDEINDMDEREKKVRYLISTGDHETGYAGFAFVSSNAAPSITYALIGSRLCLKNEALAVYCGTQFIGLWADFNLIRRR